jgi:hypothetical protein
MPSTRNLTKVETLVDRALRTTEEVGWRVTKTIHGARMQLERPTPKSVHAAKPAPTARRPRHTGTRKAA